MGVISCKFADVCSKKVTVYYPEKDNISYKIVLCNKS
jgi:hypothetical protein